jgi:hypothetical protein
MSKTILAGLALLFALGCASSGTGNPAVQKQQVFLSASLSTMEQGSFGPDFHLYDGGLLVFAHRRNELATTVDAATVDAMQKLIRESAWTKILSAMQAKNYDSYRDRPGVYLQSETRRTFVGAFVPADKLPEELRPYLRQIDEVLLRAFGPGYPVRFAELRLEVIELSADPVVPEQRLFLSLYASADQPGTHLRVYDGGLLTLSDERAELVARVDAETLAELQGIARDPLWQRLLAELATTHDVETMPEGDFSYAIRSESGGRFWWTRFPVEDLPDEMRSYLKKIDDIFQRTFGSKYPFYLSSVRTVIGKDEPPRGVQNDLTFLGTITSIEVASTGDPLRKFRVTTKVDEVLSGHLSGKKFSFAIHSPSQSGVEVGQQIRIQALATAEGYSVDEYQWRGAAADER